MNESAHAPAATTEPTTADGPGAVNAVTMYWRPGCGFCAALRAGLDRAGIGYDSVNIWDDEGAALFVRSVANGNETVPTVTVVGQAGPVSLVNPSVAQVAAALTV